MQYLSLILAYLIGSLSFAIIVSKAMHMDDPRSYGSYNAGATNVMRSGNKKAAALTLIGDCLKGAMVIWLAKHFLGNLNHSLSIVAWCGVMVVVGHIYPIFFKFKGGKGVATAAGVLLGFNLWLILLVIMTWLLMFKLFKISSLSALTATILAPFYAYWILGNNAYFGATLLIAILVLYKHKTNIVRLITGQEYKFNQLKNDK